MTSTSRGAKRPLGNRIIAPLRLLPVRSRWTLLPCPAPRSAPIFPVIYLPCYFTFPPYPNVWIGCPEQNSGLSIYPFSLHHPSTINPPFPDHFLTSSGSFPPPSPYPHHHGYMDRKCRKPMSFCPAAGGFADWITVIAVKALFSRKRETGTPWRKAQLPITSDCIVAGTEN